MSNKSDSATQTTNIPKLPAFPQAAMDDPASSDIKKIERLIKYIGEEELGGYLKGVKKYIESKAAAAAASSPDDAPDNDNGKFQEPVGEIGEGEEEEEKEVGKLAGGKKKQRKTKKKGGADIDYSKVYNVQGLIENISKSTGKDPITSQSIPAPFSTGSPLQRLGKKEPKSLPNELKNEIIPDYSQDGGKKKKTEKKKMPKKK